MRSDQPAARILVAVGLCVAAVLVACLLAGSGLRSVSVTVDEFGYLPHGLAWLDGKAARLKDGNPPQFKMLTALAVRSSPHEWNSNWPAETGEFWKLGARFMNANAARYQGLYDRARLVPLSLLAITCLLTFALGSQVYGWKAGCLAAWLTALNPNLLAHGGLLTPDIFFTAALLAVLIVANVFWRNPSSALAAVLGVCVGIACLFKVTGLLLAVLLVGASFTRGAPARSKSGGRPSWSDARYRLVCIFGITAAIHLGYAFEGSFATFGSLTLNHPGLRAIAERLPWLPTLLPADFITTVDTQLTDSGYLAYLDGRLNQTGFFDYYIWGMLYKTPPTTLLLFAAAVLIAGRPKWPEAPIVLVAVGMFAAFSLLRSKNIGIRYVLFFFPLMHVWIGRMVTNGSSLVHSFGRHAAVASVVVALAGAAVSEALVFPHHLAYFNKLAGGPAGGPTHLLDSNVDWGQDLLLLKRFMESRSIASIDLAYFGRVDPAVYGIHYRSLDSAPRQRWAAVSVNFIHGRDYFINGSQVWAQASRYDRFRTLTPVSRLGYSLYVFDLGSPAINPRPSGAPQVP